jgi:predicted DCC family thiol-disulfide oxidoreductase YuxK
VPAPAIVLFDGVCNLCDHTVQFLLDRDPEGRFVFASLQSAEGKRVLAAAGHAPLHEGADPDSIVLVEGGKAYERSTAALRIARRLGFPWKALAVFLVFPALLRDLVYNLIAKNRYRWFGRHDSCRVPTPESRARFLENRPELLEGLPS